MIKVNIRYKKMIKSGVNVKAGVLCDSIPQKNKKNFTTKKQEGE